ncbi:MAG: hypothetical protein B6U78_01375 [Candidatus Aenigmarchaeota archaeon ex4484_224]|nr:MAG: hypothetical protein B6U78_01375 [Candidatus Aenigmarchaeota archaeon ex4484_224]
MRKERNVISIFLDENVVVSLLANQLEKELYQEENFYEDFKEMFTFDRITYRDISNIIEKVSKMYGKYIQFYTSLEIIDGSVQKIKEKIYEYFRIYNLHREGKIDIQKYLKRIIFSKTNQKKLLDKGYIPVKVGDVEINIQALELVEEKGILYILDLKSKTLEIAKRKKLYEKASIPSIYTDPADKKVLDIAYYGKMDMILTADNRIVKNNPKLHYFKKKV